MPPAAVTAARTLATSAVVNVAAAAAPAAEYHDGHDDQRYEGGQPDADEDVRARHGKAAAAAVAHVLLLPDLGRLDLARRSGGSGLLRHGGAG